MCEVRMLHFSEDRWKFIQTHQYYTVALSFHLPQSGANIANVWKTGGILRFDKVNRVNALLELNHDMHHDKL